MFRVFLTKQVGKQVRKRGANFQSEVEKILLTLTLNPQPPPSKQLSGELKFIYSYHFNSSGSTFRLAYIINQKEKTITVLMIGPRENFYQQLKKKLQ